MEKISITGFGPLKSSIGASGKEEPIVIEVKKILVLIGEQASGKSTIAKLIYFFKSVPEELYRSYVRNEENDDSISDILRQTVAKRFESCFPSNLSISPFSITYTYPELDPGKDVWISISGYEGKSVRVDPSPSLKKMLEEGSRNLIPIKADFKAAFDGSNTTKTTKGDDFLQKVMLQHASRSLMAYFDLFFSQKKRNKLFIIAGRESIESFTSIFERYAHQVLDEDALLAKSGPKTFDEQLLVSFLDHVGRLKRNDQELSSSIQYLVLNPIWNGSMDDLLQRTREIIKGDYRKVGEIEKIVAINGDEVLLKNASSGQKESIRILQDIIDCLTFGGERYLRIIEEPEAHLFPTAQKHLIELLIQLANFNPENQVIITTHSPYVLTTLNCLLLANRVVSKNPDAEAEVNEIVPPLFRIDPTSFSAYSLGNSFDPNEPYCQNIVDSEIGMIQENYLDAVSDMLGSEFDRLRSIHLRSFQTDDHF